MNKTKPKKKIAKATKSFISVLEQQKEKSFVDILERYKTKEKISSYQYDTIKVFCEWLDKNK